MSYTKQNFKDGQVLKAEHLNHIEDGIMGLKLSDIENDMYYSKRTPIITITLDDLTFDEDGNGFYEMDKIDLSENGKFGFDISVEGEIEGEYYSLSITDAINPLYVENFDFGSIWYTDSDVPITVFNGIYPDNEENLIETDKCIVMLFGIEHWSTSLNFALYIIDEKKLPSNALYVPQFMKGHYDEEADNIKCTPLGTFPLFYTTVITPTIH